MMILLYAISALAALVLLVAGAVALAQAFGRAQARRRVMALDIAPEHKSAALAYFERADNQLSTWRAIWDHLRAPFVLWGPLRRLPRPANDLPDSMAYWRNDVSINGDGWGWRDAQGKWHQCSVEPTPPGIAAVPYTDPDYGGDAYYAPGHHPRSWWARWVWLALRNVASKRLKDAGPLVTQRPILLAGAPLASATQPGFALFWNGGDGDNAAYQWHSIDTWGPFVRWTNAGCKLGVPYTYPELIPSRAMLTCTWFALKKGD